MIKTKDVTLVIMAAGMGSRFGGLKQIEPIGPNDEIIADYSVYDAIRAGFNHIVFVIREENLDYFKSNIINKFEDKIDVKFAFQELSFIPKDVNLPSSRVKMLGTGHAILCAREQIIGDFAIINSDDFYGYDTFKKLYDFLVNGNADYISINYEIAKTMSANGTVKRGIVFTDENYITEIIESEVSYVDNKIIAKSLKDGHEFLIRSNQPVSMNSLGFRHNFLDLLYSEFDEFIHGEITDKNEFLIPDVLDILLCKGKIKGISSVSNSKWVGVTYKEDVKNFKEEITYLINSGEYPDKLWN